MILPDTVIPSRIKVCHIEKKYYKQFFFKIVFKIDRTRPRDNKGVFTVHDYQHSMHVRRKQKKLLESIALIVTTDDYRMRTEWYTVSLFINDESIIKELISKMSNDIYEIHGPTNEAHKEVIDNSRRIRVRKKLFEETFKFKVYLTRSWKHRETHYVDVKEWLYGIENPNDSVWKVNSCLSLHFNYTPKYRNKIGYTTAVYLNDPHDLMMFQMKFHDIISYIEEAVLLSDL